MEIWIDIAGFEGRYQISNLGNVKSLERYVFCKSKVNPNRVEECILKQRFDKDGYSVVNLKRQQKATIKKVHRLITEAFVENPLNKSDVNHINGVKTDNRLENLEWVTTKENSQHRTRTRLTKPILTDEQIEYIQVNCVIYNDGKKHKNSISDLARRFNVDRRTITDIVNKKKLYL